MTTGAYSDGRRITDELATSIFDDTLDGLEPAVRSTFVLHDVERMPLDVVAQIGGVSPEEVLRQVELAREFLRDRVEIATGEVSDEAIAAVLEHARSAPSLSPEEIEVGIDAVLAKVGLRPRETTPPPQESSGAARSSREIPTAEPRRPGGSWAFPLATFAGGLVIGAILRGLLWPVPPAPEPKVVVRRVVVPQAQPVIPPAPVLTTNVPEVPHTPEPQQAQPRPALARSRMHADRVDAATQAPAQIASHARDASVLAAADASAEIEPDAGSAGVLTEPSVAEGYSLERSLVNQAIRAIERGDYASANDALDRHRRQFVRGELSEDRDYLTVLAAEGAGSREDTRRLAAEFLRSHPGSAWAPRVMPILERAQRP